MKTEKERRNFFFAIFAKKKPANEISQEQKISILVENLAKFFADHDKITGEVNLFPLTRARDEVKRMIRENTLDYHFEWFLLQQEYLRKVSELQAKYNIEKV